LLTILLSSFSIGINLSSIACFLFPDSPFLIFSILSVFFFSSSFLLFLVFCRCVLFFCLVPQFLSSSLFCLR
jgi:hypothetical protein